MSSAHPRAALSADGRGTSVRVHQGRDVPKRTLRGILDDIGLSVDELRDLR